LIKANASIVAVQWATTGFGALAVMPMRDGDQSGKGGRLVNPPLIEAHKSSLQDFDISPFNDRLIVTSDGGAIRLWQVPEGGLTETVRNATGELSGDCVKRLSALSFHPTSENLLTTCGKDFALRLFDIENTSPVVSFKESHSDLILSTSWSHDGKLVATGCKDKTLRIGDPRAGKVTLSTEAHPGVKGFMATWLGQRDQIVTCGFSKNGERQMAIWDFRSFNTALHSVPIDTSPGMMTPYYDAATEVVFLLGRGDSSIRYYEVNDDEPYIHYLDQYRGGETQADITPFAKRLCDVGACEIVRFAKLTKDRIDHIMFQVPRKDAKDAKIFHEDLYRYTPRAKPSTTAQEWLKGKTRKTKFAKAIELMPPGFRSSYDLDPSKKAEDDKREADKRAYQELSMEERAASKEAAKKAAEISRKGGTGDSEEDEADDEATLAKFSHSRQTSASSSSGVTASSSSSDISSTKKASTSSTAASSSSIASSSSPSSSTAASSASASTSKASPSTASSSSSAAAVKLPLAGALGAAAKDPSSPRTPRTGKGSDTLEDGSSYEGDWKKDQKHGTGKFTHKPDGSVYEGAWVDDKRGGKGTLKVGSGSSAVTIDGSWIDNSLDVGNAVFHLSDGAVLEFVALNSSGQVVSGKLVYKDGESYEGAFNSSGKKHGSGVWRGKDGGKYEGEYKDDVRHGKGEYDYPDGGVYKGSWKSDLPDGEGVFHDKSGKIITGTWSKGKLTTFTVS
jgi:hypothetical protein